MSCYARSVEKSRKVVLRLLGRTHAAIGALGATIAVPLILKKPELSVSLVPHASNFKSLETMVLAIALGMLGGLMPDLDQKNALISRRLEWVGKAATIVLAFVILYASGLAKSVTGLGAFVVVILLLISQTEWMRRITLLMLACGAGWMGLTLKEPLIAGVSLAVWLCLAAFTAHRTFTHSLLGIAMIGIAAIGIGRHEHMVPFLWIFITGYALHMIADVISGGIPLLWPYRKRFGVALVKTAGMLDRMIGVLCVVLLVGVILG